MQLLRRMPSLFYFALILIVGTNVGFASDAKAYACIRKADHYTTVFGCVAFDQNGQNVTVTGMLQNLTTGLHGFHIHEFGNMSNACVAAGLHYNPFNMSHGAPNDTVRHVGDLGNIMAAADGNANISITDNVINLMGQYSVVGRTIVLHALADDLGVNKTDPGSQTTGNAGARIGCGILVPTTDCALSAFGDNVENIFLADTITAYAYAGLRPNPSYFCVVIDPRNPAGLSIRCKIKMSPNLTDESAQQANGVQFLAGACTDPVLRQQIIDSNIGQFNGTPQQIVDRLLLTVNRPNWLFLYPDHATNWNFLENDNYCQFVLNRAGVPHIFAMSIDVD